jgi:hypothetical protein
MGEIMIRPMENGVMLSFAPAYGLAADIAALYNGAPQDMPVTA